MNTQLKVIKGWKQPRLNQWLIGILLLIPIFSISYLAYHQLVVVSQQQAKQKIQTVLVERSNLTVTVSANGTV